MPPQSKDLYNRDESRIELSSCARTRPRGPRGAPPLRFVGWCSASESKDLHLFLLLLATAY